MPDNVINAMKGLTQYLMTENQRLDVEREDKKINDAASKIAEAYKNLGPNATMEDIRKLQFASINNASELGVIQEVMPLINQMQSSTLQTFAYNQSEKLRTATARFITDRYGVDVNNVTDPIAMSNLMYSRQDNEKVVGADNKTYSVKYDDQDPTKEISRREINSFGMKEQLDLYDKQKGIDYKWDSRLLRDKANYSNSLGGLTGTSPNFAGFDPLLTHQGENGEILYKSKKGRGVYALQPDGSLLFYNGQPQPTKGNVKDAIETMDNKEKVKNSITSDLANEMEDLLKNEAGREIFNKVTGSDSKFKQGEKIDYFQMAELWEKNVNNQTWDNIKSKVGKTLHDKDNAKQVWDLLSTTRTLPDKRKKTDEFFFGTTQKKGKFGKLTQDEYNYANERMLDVFSPKSTLSPEDQAGIKQWILKKVDPELGMKNVLTYSAGSYDDFKKLSNEDQLLILELINESTK